MTVHLINALEKLKTKLLELSKMTEEQVSKAVTSLETKDVFLARSVISRDDDINVAEVELEEECLKTLALYTPVAPDLRLVICVLKITNDLERISDLAANIAQRTIAIYKNASPEQMIDILAMAEKAKGMLEKSLVALVEQNVETAREVLGEDVELDEMHRNNFRTIVTMIEECNEEVSAKLGFLSVSRNLERIGALATNIAEDVIYLVEGKIVRHSFEEL